MEGTPERDFFSSRQSYQRQMYLAWCPNPFSQGEKAMHPSCSNQCLYAFLPFSMISKVLNKVKQSQTRKNATCDTNMAISNLNLICQ